MDPRYLGDGVYASFDGYHIVLTAGHHDAACAEHAIYLDPGTVEALDRYIESIKARIEEMRCRSKT